jgi:hypothetical protein
MTGDLVSCQHRQADTTSVIVARVAKDQVSTYAATLPIQRQIPA